MTPSIFTGQSGTPMPERTISISRLSLMSAAAFAAATGSTFGSPTVFTPRKPGWQSLANRKKPPNTELLMQITLSGLPPSSGQQSA